MVLIYSIITVLGVLSTNLTFANTFRDVKFNNQYTGGTKVGIH